jgi:hypothetical protein
VEWAKKLHSDFEQYMGQCWNLAYDEDEATSEEFETLSGQPYCGCRDCEVREIFTFLIPRIIEAYKVGILVEE